jgi:hypothetical protein
VAGDTDFNPVDPSDNRTHNCADLVFDPVTPEDVGYYKVQGTRYKVQGTRYKVQGAR